MALLLLLKSRMHLNLRLTGSVTHYRLFSCQKLQPNRKLLRLSNDFRICKRGILTPGDIFEDNRKFYKIDKISRDYEMIYRVKRTRFYNICKVSFNCFLVLVPVIGLLILAWRHGYLPDMEQDLDRLLVSVAFNLSDMEIIVAVVACTCINYSMSMKFLRFPVRIYFNGSKYVAIYHRVVNPWSTKQFEFTTGRRVKSLLPFMKNATTKCILGNKSFQVYPDNFKRPADFVTLFKEYPEKY